MKQFDLLGGFGKSTKSKVKIRNKGRLKTITPEIVFETKKLLSSKNKISNDEIIQISRRCLKALKIYEIALNAV